VGRVDPVVGGGGGWGAGWKCAGGGARGVAVVVSETSSRIAASLGADSLARPRRIQLACFFSGEGGGFFHLRTVSCEPNP